MSILTQLFDSSNALQKPFVQNKAELALRVLMDVKSKFKIKFFNECYMFDY